MNLPEFQYFEPKDLREASRLLKRANGRGKILAGGTDLLTLMRMRIQSPSFVIDLGALKELSFIRYENAKGLRIGALTSLAAITESAEIRARCPMLAQAANKIASPRRRRRLGAKTFGQGGRSAPGQDRRRGSGPGGGGDSGQGGRSD